MSCMHAYKDGLSGRWGFDPYPPLHDVCIAPRYSTTRGGVRRPVRRAGGSPMRDDPSHRPCYRREIPCNHNDIAPRRCPSAHRKSATPAIPPTHGPAHQSLRKPPRQSTTQDRRALRRHVIGMHDTHAEKGWPTQGGTQHCLRKALMLNSLKQLRQTTSLNPA